MQGRVWSERVWWVAVGGSGASFSFFFYRLWASPASSLLLLPFSSSSSSSSSSLLLFSPQLSSPSSRRGVSALRLPPPLPRSLPPPGPAGSLRAAAPQEDVSQGVSATTLATSTSAAAGSAERRGGVRRSSGAHRADIWCWEGDHPGHVGARLQELRGCGGVCAHKVSFVRRWKPSILLSLWKSLQICLTVCKLSNKRSVNTLFIV